MARTIYIKWQFFLDSYTSECKCNVNVNVNDNEDLQQQLTSPLTNMKKYKI